MRTYHSWWFNTSDPEAPSIIDILVLSTNQNAEFEYLDTKQRSYCPVIIVTLNIMRAYHSNVYGMSADEMNWRLLEYSERARTTFPTIREAIGLQRWTRIRRYFYVFPPSERSTDPKAPKLHPLIGWTHLQTTYLLSTFWTLEHVSPWTKLKSFGNRYHSE